MHVFLEMLTFQNWHKRTRRGQLARKNGRRVEGRNGGRDWGRKGKYSPGPLLPKSQRSKSNFRRVLPTVQEIVNSYLVQVNPENRKKVKAATFISLGNQNLESKTKRYNYHPWKLYCTYIHKCTHVYLCSYVHFINE